MSFNPLSLLSGQASPLGSFAGTSVAGTAVAGGGLGISDPFSQLLSPSFGSSPGGADPFIQLTLMTVLFSLIGELVGGLGLGNTTAPVGPPTTVPPPSPQPPPAPPVTPPPATGTRIQPNSNLRLTNDDLIDYVLAGSAGGTRATSELIDGRFARPGSRLANAGANEFDAVVARAYTGQFKAYALGLDAVFNPGDSTQTIADNIARGLNAQMTSEAQILADVAAVYRGDLTGVNTYNNRALRDLLVQWGRSDLANRPGVGQTDVESIGSVVQALNEERRPEVRQAWLQQIFDFQNNSPVSPSGAVPNLRQYQDAINIVRNGRLDELLRNYQNGIRTAPAR